MKASAGKQRKSAAKLTVVAGDKAHVDERGRAPGRGSIMWDVLTDLAHFPLLPPIAIMQSALPAVGTAVNKYGLYKSDPQGRGRRTNWSMIRFLYDGGDVAQMESKALRDLHANIKGTLDDGSKYYALHPKTFRIVPDTFLDAVVRIRADMGKPLSATERETVYEEYVNLCLMLGIPRKHIEPDIDAFYVYYEDLVRTTMTHNETVQFLMNQAIAKPARMKRFKRLQPWVDKLYAKYAYPAMRLTTVAQLHPLYRERFGIEWTATDQARYEKLLHRLQTFQRRVPRSLRYNPVAYLVMLGFEGPGLVTLEHLNKVEAKLKARLAAKRGENTA